VSLALGCFLCGNMAVAKVMASYSEIFFRSLVRESMDSRPPMQWSAGSIGFDGDVVFSRLVRIALAIAIANEMGKWEFTITWAFHSARMCSGVGF